MGVAIALIASMFVAQSVFNRNVLNKTRAQIHDVVLESVDSVEQLARVTCDVSEERILMDDYIFEKDHSNTPELEAADGVRR